jgi:membrane protein required for colicin V production
MSLIDILFLLGVLGGLALGFFQGTIRLAIAIISFYISIILASLYFQSLGRFFRERFGTTFDVAQIVAFGIILLVAFLLITTASLYTFRYAKMPASLDFVDKIIGTLLGLVLGALFLGMLAIILEQLFVFRDTARDITFPIVRAFQDGVRGSVLVQFFANNILPLIYATVKPVLPRETEIIFLIR